jgi:S-adenosylmethionine/arginine decarboxylase-like enzyme
MKNALLPNNILRGRQIGRNKTVQHFWSRWRPEAKEERPMKTVAAARQTQEEESPRFAAEKEAQSIWGLASSIDIYNCDPDLIRDAEAIRRFVVELCDLIEMKRFGETQVVNFGEDERVAGYSMTQLIETSLISAHFANLTNTVYLDVFSCKLYNAETVRNFAQKFFKGTHSILNVNPRY